MTVIVPDYRVAIGTLTAAALTADAGSVVKDWTSTRPHRWVIGATMIDSFISVQTAMNGVSRGFGLLNWEWTIGELNDDMVDVLRTELFPNGILTNPEVTARSLAKGWASGTVNLTVNCAVTWSGLQRAQLNAKGGDLFSSVRLTFFNGVVAAAGA